MAQALATVNEAANDARHAGNYKVANALVTARVTLSKQLLALSAQPSPGGQDALAALQQDYDKLLDSFNRQVEVAEKIAGRVLQQDDRIEELEEALAARQPVGEPTVVAHRYIQRYQSAEHSAWLSGDADDTYVDAERQGLGRIERAYAAPPGCAE
ncbi:hypothetical protein [Stenotrophomonas maltophilia]|uniref:hypothetical protein n=1 Tax=Stenotrophomonas maltophilia TaxID=40324 RepID=UPI0013FDF4CA|nr:hypothetical protein [Stenotrophomonas maltophilia]